MFSWKLLKFVMKLQFFFVHLFGLWPYRYDTKSLTFYTTSALRFYSALIVSFILFAYVFCLQILSTNKDKANPSDVVRFTSTCLVIFITVTYVIILLAQIRNHDLIHKWLNAFIIIVKEIHRFREGELLPFLSPIIQFVTNVLIINVLSIYSTIAFGVYLPLLHGIKWKYLLILFYILPNISITIILNTFYGSMLTITYYYRLINHHLRIIVKNIHGTNNNESKIRCNLSDNRDYNCTKESCQFSDEIDELAILHREITTFTKEINQIFSIQLLFFTAYEIFIFMTKLFVIFVTLELKLRMLCALECSKEIIWFNFIVFIVAFWTVAVVSHSCHTTIKESEETGIILHYILLNKSIDVRLRRSLDAFSMQLIQNKLKITSCGLYTMDHNVLYSIVTSTCTYMIILIQFELAGIK